MTTKNIKDGTLMYSKYSVEKKTAAAHQGLRFYASLATT